VVLAVQRVSYRWWLVVSLGVTAVISYGTSQYLFGVLVLSWQRDLHAGRATIAGAYSLGVFCSGLFGLLAGHLVDRYGGRIPLAAGSVISAAALLAMSTAQHVAWLYLCWSGLLAMGMGLTYYPMSFAAVTRWFPARRESALGLLTFLGGLSSLVFVPLSGWLVQSGGWRKTLIVMGLIQLCVAFPLHLLVVRDRPGQDEPRSPERKSVLVGRALRLRAFWTVTAGGALVMLAANVVFVYLVPYLIERGITPVTAAALAGLLGASSPPSRLLLGVFGRRFRARTLLFAVLVLAGLGIGLVVSSTGPVLVAVGVIVFGVGYGAQGPLRALVLAQQADRAVYATLSGIQNFPAAALGAGGPVLAGLWYDRFHAYEWIFVLAVAALLLAAVSTRFYD
jgi:MFS family permease